MSQYSAESVNMLKYVTQRTLNDNGLLLQTMCTENDLTITNSLFRMANKCQTTWMHPRSKHWHLIDYIIVRRWDIRDVKITRAMHGAECWTYHRLVRSTFSMHLALTHCKKRKLTWAKFNTAKLANPNTREKYQSHMDDMVDLNIFYFIYMKRDWAEHRCYAKALS